MTKAGIDPWASLVGQEPARALLESAARAPVHAYLFLGTLGSGSFQAALGFAGLILSGPATHDTFDERSLRLALEAKHPDVIVIEPEGATLRVTEAEQIIRAGLRSPVEADRKVIVVRGVDAIEEGAVGKLLKVLEEPPASAVFVLLAEEIPPELVTIASRCVIVDFVRLTAAQIETALIARGVEPPRARVAAIASGGDFERSALLATDEGLAARVELWRQVPDRLDGTGSTVVEVVNELRAGMDGAQLPLEARQQQDLEQLQERVDRLGERGSGRAELVARHKREIRRLRSDELRFGLATLARVYRDRLIDAPDPGAEGALALIQEAAENLIRNPNESLLLQDLLLRIGVPALNPHRAAPAAR